MPDVTTNALWTGMTDGLFPNWRHLLHPRYSWVKVQMVSLNCLNHAYCLSCWFFVCSTVWHVRWTLKSPTDDANNVGLLWTTGHVKLHRLIKDDKQAVSSRNWCARSGRTATSVTQQRGWVSKGLWLLGCSQSTEVSTCHQLFSLMHKGNVAILYGLDRQKANNSDAHGEQMPAHKVQSQGRDTAAQIADNVDVDSGRQVSECALHRSFQHMRPRSCTPRHSNYADPCPLPRASTVSSRCWLDLRIPYISIQSSPSGVRRIDKPNPWRPHLVIYKTQRIRCNHLGTRYHTGFVESIPCWICICGTRRT